MANVALSKRRQNFQTVSWFWDLYQRKFLDLDPPYQRRSVWNQSYKDDFIDTVLLQYSSPAIFLYEEISPDTGLSKYHVVDGKQRLTAIFDFIRWRVSGLRPIPHRAPSRQVISHSSPLTREWRSTITSSPWNTYRRMKMPL